MKGSTLVAFLILSAAVLAGAYGYTLYEGLQSPSQLSGLSVQKPSQGGTGIGSATAGDVGKVLKVSDDSPFTYELATDNTGGGGGGSFPFSADTNYGQVVYSTSTPTLWFKSGVFASSTSYFTALNTTSFNSTYASSTYASSTAVSATTFFGALVGNSSTATALAANGANCSSGNFPLGVDASGAVETCTDAWTEAENTAAAYAAQATTLTVAGTANQITSSAGAQSLAANRTWTLSLPSHVIFPGNFQATNATVTNATTTSLNVLGQVDIDGLTSALIVTGAGGILAEYAGSSCTNQFVRSLDAVGAATCATVSASDVSLANLTATDTSLTFSGTYNGSTARTIGLNVGNANTWTAIQRFYGMASSTVLSAHILKVGATASTTIDSAGNVALPTAGTLTVPALTSALLQTDGSGVFAEYAGTSCTNQFPRSLSALGIATCASVANADLANSSLTVNGIAISLGSSGTITAASSTLLANFNTWTGRQNFSNASSTLASVSSGLWIPVSTNPSIDLNTGVGAMIAVNTTAASSSVRFSDGVAERNLAPDRPAGLPFASSTLTNMGAFGAAGTTTIKQARFYRPMSLLAFYCDTDTGTAYVTIGNGTASTTGQCTSGGTLTSSSVTWTMGQPMFIGIGTSASSPNVITVSPQLRTDAD